MGTSYEYTFNKYCTNKADPRMRLPEFRMFVKSFITKVTDFEIDTLFSHFATGGREVLTLEDFIAGFGKNVKDQVFKISIEDIIKPLA